MTTELRRDLRAALVVLGLGFAMLAAAAALHSQPKAGAANVRRDRAGRCEQRDRLDARALLAAKNTSEPQMTASLH